MGVVLARVDAQRKRGLKLVLEVYCTDGVGSRREAVPNTTP